MLDQDAVKMIHGIEAQIKSLKHHLGVTDESDLDELNEDDTVEEPMVKEVGRGRKKRTVPTIGKAVKGQEEESDL